MAMRIEGPFLIICFPNSEASVKNQFTDIRPREVSGFYTSDDAEKKTEIMYFLSTVSEGFRLDCSKTKFYADEVKEFIMPFSSSFRNGLNDFHEESSSFDCKTDHRIPRMFLGGEKDRYLKFDTEDEISKRFKNILLPRISELIVEKRESGLYLYPRLRSDYLRAFRVSDLFMQKDFFEHGDFTYEQLVTELVSHYNRYSEDVVFGIHLFGMRFCKVIERSPVSTRQLIDRIHIDKRFADELEKGMRIGLFLLGKSTLLNHFASDR